MTIKRIIALLLSLLLVLTALPQMLPAAQAEPPAGICPNSPNGKHAWSKSRYIPPSCTLYGMWIYGCSLCKKQYTEITEPALGHDWSAWTRTKSPTCTENGANTRTCNRCQKVESEDIAALGHIYATKTYTSYADCTHYGAFYWTCSRCGNKSYGNDKPLGHDWDEGRMTKAPTATEDGEITYTCKRDPSHTMTETIPATGEEAQQEDHPSLELSIECDGGLRGTEWNEIGDTMWFLVVDFTLTNTGDVPLKVNTHYYNKVIELQPGESYSGINFENTRLESKGSVEWDKMTYTPDDVINLGYVDIGRVFAGHAAEDGQTDWDHPLCQSNECELRVYIKDPDHAEEDSPERVDSCSLMLTGMSDTSASYTLHTCYKHLETAEAAEALCIAGDWKEAAELWRAETDKLYDALSKTANGKK